MIESRAPGKLFVLGEYAVVEPGEPAVLVAVDRYITVRASAASGSGRIHSSEYGGLPLVWLRDRDTADIVVEHAPVDFVLAAITAVEELRAELGRAPQYFDLHIDSDLDDASGRKFGLGSSAAVTVAVIAALDEFYALGLTRAERFKVALLATIAVAPTASGGDVAASTFGGWIRYTSPDRDLLRRHRARHGVGSALASDGWSACGIRRLPPPLDHRLLVGWTGSPASTERLVDGVRRSEDDGDENRRAFLAASRVCVDGFVAALEDAAREDAPRERDALGGTGPETALRTARRLLQQLGTTTGIHIETDELRTLCDIAEQHGATAKPSGAGGGDCGIALVGAGADLDGILRAWETHDIRRLRLRVHPAEGGVDDV